MFSAALEQSEHLFRSAEAISVAARPILLFYGLSQAGKALVAAHGGQALPAGHGVKALGLDGPLFDVRVQCVGRGSFQALSGVVGSSCPSGVITFGRLYASLPASLDIAYSDSSYPATLTLTPEVYANGPLAATALAAGWLSELPSEPFQHEDPRPELVEYLSNYPTLGDWRFTTQAPAPLQADPLPLGWRLRLQWLAARGETWGELERKARLRRASVYVPGHEDHFWVLPAMPGPGEVIAPIAAWWLVLYATSMVARYAPDSWMAALDPDANPMAVPLERMLESALWEVPRIVQASLVDPKHWSPTTLTDELSE